MTFLLEIIVVLALLAAGLALFTSAKARQVEALLPPRGGFLEVGGDRLHYLDTGGSGPVAVMIHGLAGNLLHFDYAVAQRLAGEFRLVIVDRPGSGYSDRAEGADASLNAQAAAIAGLIRALKLDRPLVVGHSMGGAVSLALALHHPDCVGGLALFAPLTHPIEEVPAVFRGLMIGSDFARRLVGWTVATPMGLIGKTATEKIVFAPEEPVADFDLKAGGALILRPRAFFAASADAVAASVSLVDNVKRYPSLSVPMAMMFGKGDRLLDYRVHAEALKALVPALDLELTEGGHMMPFTAPDRCATLIRQVAAKMAVRAQSETV